MKRELVTTVYLFCFTLAAFGQEAGGGIGGTVSDPVQAAVPNAKVTATDLARGTSSATVTSQSGFYEFPLLKPGDYVVRVFAAGFEEARSQALTVYIGRQSRFDLSLKVGDVKQEVTIAATATTIETSSPDLGNIITPLFMDLLPLNGRNLVSLVGLSPGVDATSSDSQQISRGGFTVNGAPGLSNNVVLDGADATFGEYNGVGYGTSYINTVSVEGVEEFRVTSSVPSVEYGRASGGILSLSTKSGTNAFHGELFEFFRNDVMDANAFANNQTGVAKPELRFNEFGGNVGGPIKPNKIFFFFNYEGDRVATGSSTQGDVPTPALISLVTNPALAKELATMPKPNDPNVATNDPLLGYAVENLTNRTNENTFMWRGDMVLGNHNIELRYNYNHQDTNSEPYLRSSDLLIYPLRFHNAMARDTWSIGANKVNEFRLGFTRNDMNRHNSTYDTDSASVTYTLFSTDGVQSLLHFLTNTEGLADNFTWVIGNHTLKMGTDNRLLRSTRDQDTNPQMSYFSVTPCKTPATGTLNCQYGAQHLINDTPDSVTITFGTGKRMYSNQIAFYGEDNWRVSRRFSVIYGLRYDYFSPEHGGYNIIDSNPFAPFQSDKFAPFFHSQTKDFAPRAGVVWDVLGNSRLVWRAGGALMYVPPQPFFVYDAAFLNPLLPFNDTLAAGQVPAGVTDKYPFPKSYIQAVEANPSLLPPAALGRQIYDYNHKDEYSENWNTNIQYGIARSLVAQVSYVGLRDLHGLTYLDPNQFPNGTCVLGSAGNGCPARPDPALGNINYGAWAARSTYDALHATLNYSHGRTQATFHYMHASAMQLGNYNNNNADNNQEVQDPNNLRSSYGPSDGIARDRITGLYSYQPVPGAYIRNHRALNAILNNWSFQGVWTYRSGLPNNVVSGNDEVHNNRSQGQRPDYVWGQPLYLSGTDAKRNVLWLNPSAFSSSIPAKQIRYGDLGFNAVWGPDSYNLDASVVRHLKIREGQRLDFRAEFFNVLNHDNLGQPIVTMTDPNFGKILARSSPRYIQLALKYFF